MPEFESCRRWARCNTDGCSPPCAGLTSSFSERKAAGVAIHPGRYCSLIGQSEVGERYPDLTAPAGAELKLQLDPSQFHPELQQKRRERDKPTY